MLDRLRQDLRYAIRALARRKAYGAAAVGMLAVGIGADVAIFSAANAFLFRPVPFADEERLVAIYETNPEFGWDAAYAAEAAPANVLDWRERVGAFDDVATYSPLVEEATWIRDGEPTLLKTGAVSGNYFDVLGVPPLLGRNLRWEETFEGGAEVAVLSHAFWTRAFGADPDVVGRTLDLEGSAVQIVGVTQKGFGFPSSDIDLWTPYAWEPAFREAVWFRRAHFVRPVARLAPGVSLEAADAEFQAVVTALQGEYPETNRVMGATLVPVREYLVGDIRMHLRLLLGAGALLLLLACINVSNLSLVRGGERKREVALRYALGARQSRVAMLVLHESLLIALLAGAAGLGLGWLGVRGIGRLTELGIEGATSAALDHRVVLFALAATAFSGVAVGLLPTLRAARGDVPEDLRDGGRGGTSGGRHRAAGLLVASEVALALLLVAGAGLMARTLWALRDVDPGFNARGVLAVQVNVPSNRYPDRGDVMAFWDELLESLEGRRGIRSAGTVGQLPLNGTSWSSQLKAQGWGPEREALEVIHRRADEGYFQTLDIPLIQGRMFGPQDRADSPPVIVVNETFARQHFAGEDPIGQRVTYDRVPDESSTWREIVGVVGDQHQESPGVPPRAEVFEHRDQDWARTVWVVVGFDGEADAALPVFQEVLGEVDPLIPLVDVRPLRQVWRDSMARQELVLTLLGVFGGLALLLAAVGVFAVTAQATRRRTHEIGVRMALGAAGGDVVRMVLSRGLRSVVLGLMLGVAGTLVAGRVLDSLLYGVAPNDPVTLGAVAALLLGVAGLACWVPARRATGVDPVRALQE
jgi:putative ABC transport system permease protein